jgi:transposase-like protein
MTINNRNGKYNKYIELRKKGINHADAASSLSVHPSTIRRWVAKYNLQRYSGKRKTPRNSSLDPLKEEILQFIRSEQRMTRQPVKKVRLRQFVASISPSFATKTIAAQDSVIRKFLELNKDNLPPLPRAPSKVVDDGVIYPCSIIECMHNCEKGTNCTYKRLLLNNRCAARREVKKINCQGKGNGLLLCESVRKDDFIIEYFGRVISPHEIQQKNINREYWMEITGTNTTIDGDVRGNYAKFINHSCEPNCKAWIWTVNGVDRVAITALHAIKSGTELTFDYQWTRIKGRPKTKCLCGSSKCRKWIEK